MTANLPHALACVWQLCSAVSCVSWPGISAGAVLTVLLAVLRASACHSSPTAELAVLHGQSSKLAPVSKHSQGRLRDSQGGVHECYSSILIGTLQTWQVLLQQLLSFLQCHAQSQALLEGNMNSQVRLFVFESQGNVIVTLLIFVNTLARHFHCWN